VAIATLCPYGGSALPASLVSGWLVVCFFTYFVGIAMA